MLRLSTKGRYAARILVYLAMHAKGGPARKRDIADAEDLTPDYVEQILMRLKTAGIVQSHRGAKGGFSLAQQPDTITFADVLRATEGPISLAPCLDGPCERTVACVTQTVWREANDALIEVLAARTIGEMAVKAEKLSTQAEAANFTI